MKNNGFINNFAFIKGGSFVYTKNRPMLIKNYFDNNTALDYGNNYASYPIRLEESNISLKEKPPLIKPSFSIPIIENKKFNLIDFENQLFHTDIENINNKYLFINEIIFFFYLAMLIFQ